MSLESTLVGYNQQIAQAEGSLAQAGGQLALYDTENASSMHSSIVEQDRRVAELENAHNKAKQVVD